MNCRTCQFELSQCLDGRLPSGRRALVMQHAETCSACAEFWSELQKAQELVLRLPAQHTGPDFREQLFARIRSGEGTPDAVFHEPVPIGTKIRYAFTGAAAAAAALFTVWLWHEAGSTPVAQQPVAKVTPDAGTNEPTATSANLANVLQPRTRRDFDPAGAAFMNSVEPLTPDLVASEVAEDLRDNLSVASRCATRLVSGQPGTVDGPFAHELHNRAGEVQRLGSVLLELQQTRHVAMPEPVYYQLRYTVDQLDEAMPAREPASVDISRIARVVLRARDLADLPQRLQPGERTRLSPTGTDQELVRLFQSHPDTLQRLFLWLPSDGNFDGLLFDPVQRLGVFQFQNDCGQNFVVSRRQMERRQAHFQVLIQSQDGGSSGSVHIEVGPPGQRQR